MASFPNSSNRYSDKSLWLEQIDNPLEVRPPLPSSRQADVAIVGAGMTGLWTAYYLARAVPSLQVVVIETETVGSGASGRNGGWVGAGIAGSAKTYARTHGKAGVEAATRATNEAVDEIGRVITDENIKCDFTKAGTVVVATTEPQRLRLAAWHDLAQAQGTWSPGERILDPSEVAEFVKVPKVRGGFFTPHCASAHPARLVRGLADACERRGVAIHELTEAVAVEPGIVRTTRGDVTAPSVIRATEAFTTRLAGEHRRFLPLTSLLIATEPLPSHVWDEIGARPGLTVRDRRHLFFYARRTADDRLALGGRGAPYPWRRPFDESNFQSNEVRGRLIETMREHFPAAQNAAITHHWGGALAVPRDWSMAINFDTATQVGWAGGYSGHGVVAANISGRTLADLVTRQSTELTALPWVNHRSPKWEPEPLRYLASQSIVRVLGGADKYEDRSGLTAKRVRVVQPFLPSA